MVLEDESFSASLRENVPPRLKAQGAHDLIIAVCKRAEYPVLK